MNIHRQEMKKKQGIFLFSPPFRVSGSLKTGQKSLKLTAKTFYFHLTFCHNRLLFPYNHLNKNQDNIRNNLHQKPIYLLFIKPQLVISRIFATKVAPSSK